MPDHDPISKDPIKKTQSQPVEEPTPLPEPIKEPVEDEDEEDEELNN